MRYRESDAPWDQGIVAPEVERFAAEHPGRGARALDIGCGTGTHGRELARRGYRVIGLDLSHVALRQALAAARAENLDWLSVQGSATDIAMLDATFAAALDVGCFHALTEAMQAAYADGLARRLAAGGHYLLYAVHPREEGQAGPPGVAPAQIERVFGPRFDLVWKQEGWQGERRADWWLWRASNRDER